MIEKTRADEGPTQGSPGHDPEWSLLHELRIHQLEIEKKNEELSRTQEELKISRAKYCDLYDRAPVGYVTLSAAGIILEANLTSASLLGVRRDSLIGQPLSLFIVPEDHGIYDRHRKKLLETGALQMCEMKMLKKDAAPFQALLEATAAESSSGSPLCRVVMSDITELQQKESALKASLEQALEREQQLSHTDTLTGIHNRRYFMERAAHLFEMSVRYQNPLSVILFDIDDFKEVNDTFGHAVGDQLLKHVAQMARTELRSADVIGRYGGDEFVIALPFTTAMQAYSLAERLRRGVEALLVQTQKGKASVTLSIGIAETVQSSPADDIGWIINCADEAMYAAKQSGKNLIEKMEAKAAQPIPL